MSLKNKNYRGKLMQEHSDKELLELFREKANRERAFNLILQKYQERVYWHVRKLLISHDDTDDVLQEIFIKVWNKLDDFRGESSLFTWIYRIATNESLNFLRRKSRHSTLSTDDEENHLSDMLKADPYFNGDEIRTKLQSAIAGLPDKQRVVFNMKYFDEMKYEDMAEILETSTGALKASYHHAVKKIEKFLNDD